jgi:hypothetical protein
MPVLLGGELANEAMALVAFDTRRGLRGWKPRYAGRMPALPGEFFMARSVKYDAAQIPRGFAWIFRGAGL